MPYFSQPTILHKRASIDLNRTPSPEAQEEVTQFESSNAIDYTSVHPISHILRAHGTTSNSANSDGNKTTKNRKKPVQTEEERKRRKNQSSSNARIRKVRMAREALREPSKMTPKLQQWIERYKETNRRNSAKQYAKLKNKIENNLPLTEREHKRIQSQNKTKEWRSWNPKNQAKYEIHLERNRRKRKQQKEAKAAIEQQKRLQKRTLQFELSSSNETILHKRGDLDLNSPPPEEESSTDKALNDTESAQGIADLTNNNASRKNKLTPEERKRRKSQNSMNARRRKREMVKEALKDPSKMTPDLLRWSKNYKATNRRGSAKQYAKLKTKYENNLPLTESAKNWFESTRYKKEWRDRHPDNQIRYEKHLKQRKDKRRQDREAKVAKNQESKGFQKRAFDLNKSPEPESDQSPTHDSQAEKSSKKRKRTSPTDGTRIQKKPFEAHSSQITPEIQKYIDRSEAKRIASKRSYAKLMEKKRKGETLTPQQQKRYGALYHTREWRKSSEMNEARYARVLQRRKEKDSRQKDETYSAKVTCQSKSSFDMNDLSKIQSRIDEEKAAKKERNNRYYRQRMERFKAARKDPSKMTPQLQEEIERYYRKNNKSTKRYHKRVKTEKAQRLKKV